MGSYPEGITSHPNGKDVYVANWFNNTVSVLNSLTLEVEANILTGEGSRAFGGFIGQGRK